MPPLPAPHPHHDHHECGRHATHRFARLALLGASLCAALAAPGCATARPSPARSWAPGLEALPAGGAPVTDGASTAAGDEITLAGDPSLPRAAAAPAADEWVVTVAPYVWMLAVDGKLRANGQVANVDVSFSDMLENLDLAAMVHVEAWNGDWGFAIDPVYGSLSVDGKVGPDDYDVEQDILIIDALALRHLATSDDGDTQLDGLAGIRYWDMDVDVDSDSLGIHESGSVDWVDGIIGARVITKLDDAWELSLRGDVGGFGIGSSADREYSATATVSYVVNATNRLLLGYRLIELDKSSGSGAGETGANVGISGPAFGWQFAF